MRLKKFLQTTASVLAGVLMLSSLPVMPVTEAEAASGNSGNTGFPISLSHGSGKPLTTGTVVPLITVTVGSSADLLKLSERLPTDDQAVTKTMNDISGKSNATSWYMPGFEGANEDKGKYYVSLLGQVQSARESVLYKIPRADRTNSLYFGSVAMADVYSGVNPAKDGSWVKSLTLGEIRGDNSDKDSKVESRTKIWSGAAYKNDVVYPSYTYANKRDDDLYNILYQDYYRGSNSTVSADDIRDINQKSYEKLYKNALTNAVGNTALDKTYHGVYIDTCARI